MTPVVVQKWTETERGWGQRPDGVSVHLTSQDCRDYIADYWKSMPKGPAPDEYSFDSGYAYVVNLPDDHPILQELRSDPRKLGVRYWNTPEELRDSH